MAEMSATGTPNDTKIWSPRAASGDGLVTDMTPILDAIDCGIIIVDRENRVRLANRKASLFFGAGAQELQGHPVEEIFRCKLSPYLLNPENLMNWLEIEKRVFDFSIEESLRPSSCEVRYRDGSTTLLVQAAPLPGGRSLDSGVNSGDLLEGRLLLLYDITEKRRTEEILDLVSFATREVNRDLNIPEMLPRLFTLISERVPLDAMAIISVTEDGRGQVVGAIPNHFLGGIGANGALGSGFVQGQNEGLSGGALKEGHSEETGAQILVDIVSDIPRSLSKELPDDSGMLSMLPRSFLEELSAVEMQSMAALPLNVFGRVSAIWVLASRQTQAYSHAHLTFLEPLSEHLAVAVHNAQLLQRTKDMYSAAVKALAATVDIRDAYTMHHSEHVATIAKIVAAEMGLPAEEVEVIELAGLVHDIGKVGIPDAVLQKPGPLDPSERAVMTNHSVLGAGILERAGMLRELAPMVLHHHEWHNGSGYPNKLRGSSIPLGAAILSVADAFDTMVSDRVYRPGMSLEEARAELRRCSGGQFHPGVVAVLEKAIDKALKRNEPWLLGILGVKQDSRQGDPNLGLPRTLVEQAQAVEKAITSKELGVFFKITQEMRKLLDLKELLNHILQILADEMGYSDCVILLPDKERRNLVVAASMGFSKDLLGIKIPEGSGISWWVMKHGIPQNVPDVSRDERYYEGAPGVGSELYIPLDVRGKRLGVLLVQKAETGGFGSNDVRLLMAVAGHIAAALEVAQLHEEAKRAADTDALTGVFNRRKFLATLEGLLPSVCHEEYPRAGASCPESPALPSPGQVSVVIMDIDCLKRVNDTYGHLAGDRVLVQVADDLVKGFRVCDVVARYGGDEFVVLLPGAPYEAAEKRIKDIMESWKNKTLEIGDGRILPMPGASYGVASSPQDGCEARVLLSAADNRLLQAKPISHAGRYG